MEHVLIIVIFACGLLAMLIELFIPGAVMGVLGFLAVVGSVAYSYVKGYSTTGTVLMLITLAYIPVFFLLWKNVMGKFFALTDQETGFRPSRLISEDLMGKEGEALSALRPSGIASIDGKRFDVVTQGEMLDKGVRVRVIEVSGNRLVVRKI